MCTLTIVPTESGYLVGMNRDELRTRPQALPGLYEASAAETRFISPREASGGTWIASNDHGNTLALLNWNLREQDSSKWAQISRGTIISQLITLKDDERSIEVLQRLSLASFAPFRLVGIFSREKAVKELRWNGRALTRQSFPWQRGHWFSSSASDELAAKERGLTCESAAAQWPANQAWIRRLHRTHTPHARPFSVCVHREEAVTVSYTEVSVSVSGLTMSYLSGSPCQKEEFDSQLTLGFRPQTAVAAT